MMADVDEIIHYIKSLKRGFDKDLFQIKIDELGYAVDTTGLHYDDFHMLFEIWLNLSIPITKWVSLGVCVVPPNRVEERTVKYALCWLLANNRDQLNYSRINFLFDWLTAAMDTECIDMKILDIGYEVFFKMLSIESMTPHLMKLVYTLTKPMDVTRLRVLELLDYAKSTEANRSINRQLQILLGLFKSYKPECVPEGVPAISKDTAFRKLNVNLVERFKRIQARQNTLRKEREHLRWINSFNSDKRNLKAESLLPNMEFVHIGSKQYTETVPQKTYLDFSEPVSLVGYSLHHPMCRPARLRSLLCNETGLMLLTVASKPDQEFFSNDLHHVLTSCFLEISLYSYTQKQNLLWRIVLLQRTLLQGIPVVTRFLALYIPFWNEKDFFSEILDLAEWVSVECVEHVKCIAGGLARVYHRARRLEQCAILCALANMYSNLMHASKKDSRLVFMGAKIPQENFQEALFIVAAIINDTCNKGLQVNPEDMRTLQSCVRGVEAVVRARWGAAVTSPSPLSPQSPLSPPSPLSPAALALALPLLSVSAALIDTTAAILGLYNKKYMKGIENVKEYATDMIGCLYLEEAFSCRKDGLVLKDLHPKLVKELTSIIPNIDAILSIRNHLAFAPYMTYIQDNKLFINAIIEQELPNLYRFFMKAVPELRS